MNIYKSPALYKCKNAAAILSIAKELPGDVAGWNLKVVAKTRVVCGDKQRVLNYTNDLWLIFSTLCK